MTDLSDFTTRADLLIHMRAMLAALQRELANKGAGDLIDLAKQADEIAKEMLKREMQ
jgi:hypothetical protein